MPSVCVKYVPVNDGSATTGGSSSCLNVDLIVNEAKPVVAELLKKRLLPRTTHALYVDCPENVRMHLPSILETLWNDRTFRCAGDGAWCMGAGNGQEKTPLQKAMLIGPVWEPLFADALRKNDLPIEQQRHECGYYLDIAVVDGEHKLDVEVDGRHHRVLPSQRAKDIVRDYRLKANGWIVLRINVSDIIASLSSSVEKVITIWNEIKKGETVS